MRTNFAAQMHHGIIMIRALLKFSEFLNTNYPNLIVHICLFVIISLKQDQRNMNVSQQRV